MGFFSDIILDAKRQVATPEEAKPGAFMQGSTPLSKEAAAAATKVSEQGMMTDFQAWEENDRTSASLMTQPERSVVRQVMDLSLSEDIPAKESPSSDSALNRLSHCGKRNLTGVRSARTVPAGQDSGQISAFADCSDTLRCSHTATSSAQLKESLFPVQTQGTGKMARETRRRRLADGNIRAGAITPPNFSSDCDVSDQHGETVPEAKLSRSETEESIKSGQPFFQGHEAAGEPVSQSSRHVADNVPRQSELQENEGRKNKLKYQVEILDTEISAAGSRESLPPPDFSDQSSEKNSAPRITIELLEVTVVSADDQSAAQIQGRETVSSDFSSRLYLQNI